MASATLITSTSVTVIACGDNDLSNPEPEKPESGFQELINDFKKDLTTIKDEYWREKTDNFFSLVEFNEEIFYFLTKEK
ncbi:hypothetical protein STAIW_v1c04110 [Spiroplasma taiwanense CT-1]|uniref:Uncharacterized protein n=1 Tax=Spiroplasma taiwanense CT-1 TaxID=1276220 RepID=S5LWP4_9MOLU|nr:hypothetical protein STAIW_v1c04110 [Spiroplasma taiwanense CT-1]